MSDAGADVNASNSRGWTPFHRAIIIGDYFEIAKYLVENGANVNAPKNNGWTPLHLAILDGDFEIVKYLVENGADVNAKTNKGETPLSISESETFLFFSNTEITDYLKSVGAR